MLNGETINSGAPNQCKDCKTYLHLQVLRSAAGYYLGTECDCGPYSRESDYFGKREHAEQALDMENKSSVMRDDSYNPGTLEVIGINDVSCLWY